MVALRKEKQSFLPQNLVYLRKQKDKTLEEMAELLSLAGKSSYKAYEEGRALPDIHKLMRLATFFDVGVVDLVYQDLESFKTKNSIEKTRQFKIVKIPVAAAAGYSKGFEDADYIKKFKIISIPFEPYGIARAFDISGDSMEPEIRNGSTVIGIKVSRSEIKDRKSYVIVSTDGIQCKQIRHDQKSEFLYLISLNTNYPPKHVRKDDVFEVWEVWKIL